MVGRGSQQAALTTMSATNLVGYPSGMWESSLATDYVSLRRWRPRVRTLRQARAVGAGKNMGPLCRFWTTSPNSSKKLGAKSSSNRPPTALNDILLPPSIGTVGSCK